jgi:hypothetical protein
MALPLPSHPQQPEHIGSRRRREKTLSAGSLESVRLRKPRLDRHICPWTRFPRIRSSSRSVASRRRRDDGDTSARMQKMELCHGGTVNPTPKPASSPTTSSHSLAVASRQVTPSPFSSFSPAENRIYSRFHLPRIETSGWLRSSARLPTQMLE